MSNHPDPAMLSVAERLAAFLVHGGKHLPEELFVDGDVAIIENFAPFLFHGPEAVARWAEAMRLHLKDITGLICEFGDPIDFCRSEDEVYFSLPTTWSGLNHGMPFRELGGWALILKRLPNGWRLKGYGWGVVQHARLPLQ